MWKSVSAQGSALVSRGVFKRGVPPKWAAAPPKVGVARVGVVARRVHCMASSATEVQPSSTAREPFSPPALLSREEVLHRLYSQHRHANTPSFRAFYSSVVGGITRDPAAMVVPIDDHMVHRGHAVFDTAIISEGFLYELDEHLDRLLRSAKAAKIRPLHLREELRSLLLATAAASGLEHGYLRYWLSVGPGGFSISPAECPSPSFYILAISENLSEGISRGKRVVTATVPMKSPAMATTKTVNYLPNALAHVEAEEAGVDEAIWVDEQGHVGEGPTMNVAFVSAEGYLLVPSFERILAGCTVQRIMKLAEKLTAPKQNSHDFTTSSSTADAQDASTSDADAQSLGTSEAHPPLLKGVKLGPVREEDARKAREMMLVGSGTQVSPVVLWDGVPVGTGSPGPVAAALHALLQEAYRSGPLVPIPKLYQN